MADLVLPIKDTGFTGGFGGQTGGLGGQGIGGGNGAQQGGFGGGGQGGGFGGGGGFPTDPRRRRSKSWVRSIYEIASRRAPECLRQAAVPAGCSPD